jgi:hypothetical protein
MYDESSGKLSIDKKTIGSGLYDYEIVSGSSYAVDQESQQRNLTGLLELLLKNPQLVQVAMQEGYQVKTGKLLKRIISMSGIQDWDKIIGEMKPEEMGQEIMNQDMATFQQAIQQMQGMQGTGQIPTQPNEMPQGGESGQVGY